MSDKLFQETFSRLKASEQAKEALLNMAERNTGKRKVSRAFRTAAIAAAVGCLLTMTALATIAAGGLEFENGFVVLGRFARGLLVDENGRDRSGNEIDPSLIWEEDGSLVAHPALVASNELVKEDGRVMLYFQYGIFEEALDITERLREDGGYSYYAREDGYTLSAEVYPVGDGRDGLSFEGTAYRLHIKFTYPSLYYDNTAAIEEDNAGGGRTDSFTFAKGLPEDTP